MSGPPLTQQDIFAKAKQLRDAGVPLNEIDQYVTAKLGNLPPHSKLSAAQLIGRANRSVENAQDEEALAAAGTPATRALGTITSLARDVPGAEAAQAGVRSLVRRQPYRAALSDIRGAEDTAPAYTAIPARIVGTALSTAALPGGVKTKGMLYGALRAALDADPVSTGGRVVNTALQGALGYGVGRLAQAGGTALRAGRDAVMPLVSAARGAVSGAIAPVTEGWAATAPSALAKAAAPVAEEAAPAASRVSATNLSRADASQQLAALLSKNVEEGAAAVAPKAPATDWDLMQRIESALNPRNRIVPHVRPQPVRQLFPPSP